MNDESEIFFKGQNILKNSVYREDCKILFDSENAMEYKLDEVGIKFYEYIISNISLDNVVLAICNYYNITDIEMLKNDVIEFLSKFIPKQNNKVEYTASGQIEKNIEVDEISFPFALELELTKICNFRCPFCYNTWKYEKEKENNVSHLSKDAIFRLMNECKDNNLLKIRYSGGEPTLYPGLDELLKYGKNLGFFQSIFTNAYMLTDEKIKLWQKNNVKEVLISLHGNEVTHEKITLVKGSYKKTLDNVKKLLLNKIKVIVEMTLVSYNLNEVEDVIETLYQIGVKEFRIMKYVPTGSNFDSELSITTDALDEVIEQLENNRYSQKGLINIAFPCSQKFCTTNGNIDIDIYDKKKKFLLENCMAGINWVAVDYQGFVKICPHSYKKYMNINEKDFSILKVWKDMTKPKTQEILDGRKEKCHKCIAWKSCYGGCLLK